jgi:hypothetical protein
MTEPQITLSKRYRAETTYLIVVKVEGIELQYFAKVYDNVLDKYVNDINCIDKWKPEYIKMKKSLKKKIKKIVLEEVKKFR